MENSYINRGPLSQLAKARIAQLLREGKDREAIYEAIGRSGRAVDRLIDAARPARRRSAKVEPALLEHRYWLRPNLDVTLRLPPNLSGQEASRLAELVRNLAFG